jgi:hypothetical protein
LAVIKTVFRVYALKRAVQVGVDEKVSIQEAIRVARIYLSHGATTVAIYRCPWNQTDLLKCKLVKVLR